jgi:protein TonB
MGPITLSSELSVSCPDRPQSVYPLQSEKRGEEGQVILRVELDESGQVVAVQIHQKSGFSRLDEAASAAVKNWKCHPALRNGAAVRAVALQPFNFSLN